MLDRDHALGRETELSPMRTRWLTFGSLGFVAVFATALRGPRASLRPSIAACERSGGIVAVRCRGSL
jgi:hypothetical protein